MSQIFSCYVKIFQPCFVKKTAFISSIFLILKPCLHLGQKVYPKLKFEASVLLLTQLSSQRKFLLIRSISLQMYLGIFNQSIEHYGIPVRSDLINYLTYCQDNKSFPTFHFLSYPYFNIIYILLHSFSLLYIYAPQTGSNCTSKTFAEFERSPFYLH